MRIGFTGAGGTGKTTLAQALATETMPYVPSVVRSAFARAGIRREDDQLSMTAESRFELQRVIWYEKRKLDEAHPNGYFDRTPLDHYVYMLFRCYEVMNDMDVLNYQRWVREALNGYDLIFYCPANAFVQVHDTVRVQSLAYANMIDHMIRGIIEDWHLNVDELALSQFDERMKYINIRLKQHGIK